MVFVGAVITIYANKIYESMGPMAWAEEHLGTEGGPRVLYKLIGIGLCVLGFLTVTNLLTAIIISIIQAIFPQMIKPPTAG